MTADEDRTRPIGQNTRREVEPTLLGEMLSLGPRLASRTISQIQASQLLMSILSCSSKADQESDAVPTSEDGHTMREPVDVLGVLREDDGRSVSAVTSGATPDAATELERSAADHRDPGPGSKEVLDAEPPTAEAGSSHVPDAADLVIPGYDSLAASQVVPRLTTLSSAELSAVGAYEEANRGRRTILNRVRQLRASSDGGG